METQKKKRLVKKMFSGISANYDLVNSIASLFIDHYWRARAIKALDPRPGELILDLCSGTMPLARALRSRVKAHVICLDISAAMLKRGMSKYGSSSYGLYPICGDAEKLPFPDNTFDAAMVAFGIRNLADLNAGLNELYRVIRPKGRVVVLEFSRPTLPIFAQIYKTYLNKFLIPFGGAITNDRNAYEYLVRTIYEFYTPEEVVAFMRRAALRDINRFPLTGGCVTLYIAWKTDGFHGG